TVTQRFTDPELGAKTAVTTFEYGDAVNLGRVTRTVPPRGNTGASPDYSYATTFVYYTTDSSPTDASNASMLASVTDPLSNTTTFTYDAVGRRLTMVDPNGNVGGAVVADHTWEYSYDKEDRLRFAKAPPPAHGGAQLVTEYRYDAVGNRTVAIDANGQVTKYLYDERNSLSEEDESR